MTVLGRLLGGARRVLAPVERRYLGSFGASFGSGPMTAGGVGLVNSRLSENLSAVTACVSIISNSISTLPARVYRSLPNGGREEVPLHPMSALIRRPNERQSWPDWLSMTVSQVLLFGNALSIVQRDHDGNPVALIPIPWQNVNVQLLPNGRLCFDVLAMVLPWGGTGSPRRLLDTEVFFLKALSDDGYLGRSVLARAPSVLHTALGAQRFAGAVYDNFAAPSGAIRHAAKLNPEAKAYLATKFEERFQGGSNAGRTIVLDEGMTYDPLGSMSPEASELLASRRFSGEEIARLFNVPAQLIGENQFGSFSNVTTAGQFFSKFCLAPWVKRIECEIQRSILVDDDTHHVELDLSGLMRGDDTARWAAYAIALDRKVLSVNEVRAAEGYSPTDTPDAVPGDAA